MTIRLVRCAALALVGLAMTATSTEAQTCEADGDIEFVCGPVSPEDLAAVPDAPWVIVASWQDDGYLSLAHTGDHRTVRLYPTPDAVARLDTTTYGGCPGPMTERFHAHGISLRPGDGGRHTLYVVRHGAREAIEVFEIDTGPATPTATWIGCAVAPDDLGLNAVVALPDGGFGVTSPRTGDIWEWQTGEGWTRVPGSEDIGPNGLEVSPDGAYYYVAGYAAQAVLRLTRGVDPPVRVTIANVGFNIDNIHWADDGTILAAGHETPTRGRVGECIQGTSCDGIVSRVAAVNPRSAGVRYLFSYPSNERLRLGTTAIQVGDELWVGSVAGSTRIARVSLP